MIINKTPLILICLLVLFNVSCNNKGAQGLPTDLINNPNSASGEINNENLPFIEFEKMYHEFGKVYDGEIVTYSFKFSNTGKSDLIISKVSSSCGCTVSKFSEEPLIPGDSGFIEVSFDSKKRLGRQIKSVTVMANTQPSTHTLRIKADVVQP